MEITEKRARQIFFWLIIASLASLLIYTTQFSTATIPKTLFFYAIVELTLPVYLYLCLKFYGFGHLKNPIVYLSAAFFASSFISALVGVDFIRSFWGNFERMQGLYLSLHVFLWMLYLILLFKVDRKKIDLIIEVIIGIAVFASILGILQQIDTNFLSNEFIGRSTSIFDNPIFFAAYLVIPFFLCFYQANKGNKWWYFGWAALILIGMIVTKTAGAYVGLVAGVATSVVIYTFERKKIRLVARAGLVLVIAALIFGFAAVKVPQLKNKFLGSDAQERIIQWQIALRGFVHKPIFGVGPENYGYISDKYINPRLYNYTNAFFDKPHNYFLEILATRGIVGFGLYVAGLWVVVGGLFRQYRSQRLSKIDMSILIGALVAYAVQNFFAFDIFGGLLMLTLLYSIGALGWESENTISAMGQGYINAGIVLTTVLFIFLMVINVTTTKANIYLTNGIKYQQANINLSESYFERLQNFPFYVDREGIDLAYESFINQVPQQTNNTSTLTVSDYVNWINKTIDYNQKLIDQEPSYRYYIQTQVALAQMYLIKSQLVGSVDPKLYQICAFVNQLAPNRIEANLILATAYTYSNQFDQAQALINQLQKIAPNNEDVIWSQVYLYAVSGQTRLVLDRTKEIISKNFDDKSIAEIDRFAKLYLNEYYYSAAQALYNEAIQMYPDRGYLYVQLAGAYSAAGDKTTAGHVIDTLKQKDPATYVQYNDQINNILKPSQLQIR